MLSPDAHSPDAVTPTPARMRFDGATPSSADDTVSLIEALFRRRGARAYTVHGVTQDQHALQCASLARDAGHPDSLVAAALLHDIGHMLSPGNGDIADMHRDQRHEATGAAWLAEHFGRAVSEPVRLHVSAKRYLCTTEDAYLHCLSEASVCSLSLQGGPMNRAECEAFERTPWWREAVILRHLDDASKEAGHPAIGFATFEPLLQDLAHAHERARRRDRGAA